MEKYFKTIKRGNANPSIERKTLIDVLRYYDLWYDEIQMRPMYGNEPIENSLYGELRKFECLASISKQMMFDVITEVSKRRTRNLYKEFFEKEEWDGVDRIDELFKLLPISKELVFVGEEQIYRRVWKKWFIGVIAKLYMYALTRNSVLILQSTEQGVGKTLFLGGIFSEFPYSMDKYGEINPAKQLVSIQPDIDEIMMEQDSSYIKRLFNAEWFSFRKTINSEIITVKSITSFMGTTNRNDFLQDDTGERRYIVFPLTGEIKIPEYLYDRSWALQLAAQMYHLFSSGRVWYLTTEENDILKELNEEFKLKKIASIVAELCEPGEEVMNCLEIYEKYEKYFRPSRTDLIELSACLQARGLKRDSYWCEALGKYKNGFKICPWNLINKKS